MGRREMREHIFKLLFFEENLMKQRKCRNRYSCILKDFLTYSPQKQAYMENKYTLVKEHLEEIDVLLNEKSAGWKTKRMSKVDLNILRLDCL